MNRRILLSSWLLPIVWSFKIEGAAAQEVNKGALLNSDQAISFRWTLNSGLANMVLKDLPYDGKVATETNSKGIPLLVIIVGIALLPNLVDAILKLRDKLTQPGIVIDARGKELKIEVSRVIPKGYILLTDATGARLYNSTELKDPAELTKILAESAKK